MSNEHKNKTWGIPIQHTKRVYTLPDDSVVLLGPDNNYVELLEGDKVVKYLAVHPQDAPRPESGEFYDCNPQCAFLKDGGCSEKVNRAMDSNWKRYFCLCELEYCHFVKE